MQACLKTRGNDIRKVIIPGARIGEGFYLRKKTGEELVGKFF
jgi:hypothetical protein